MAAALDTFFNDIETFNVDGVAAALANGAIDVNQADDDGQIPLFVAVEEQIDPFDPNFDDLMRRKVETIKLLVKNGANLERENNYGKTVLLYAIEQDYSNLAVVKALLDLGADPNQKLDHIQIIQSSFATLLLFYGAKTEFATAYYIPPFSSLKNLYLQFNDYKFLAPLDAIAKAKNLTPEQRAIERALLLDKQAEFVSVASTSPADTARLNSLFLKAQKLKWAPMNHNQFLSRFNTQTYAFLAASHKFSKQKQQETKDFTQLPDEILQHITFYSSAPSDVDFSTL